MVSFLAEIPDIWQGFVGIARDERSGWTIQRIRRTMNRPDVRAIDVNADRDAIVVGVPHTVDVADGRRDGFDRAAFQPYLIAGLLQGTVVVALVWRSQFCATQHAYQAPHPVVVNRGALSRPPDEADHREALARIGVKQELLIAIGRGLRVGVGQPVVNLNEFAQRIRSPLDQVGFAGVRFDQFCDLAHKLAQFSNRHQSSNSGSASSRPSYRLSKACCAPPGRPTWACVRAATSCGIGCGVPAASASSCVWQAFSSAMYHHAAASTVGPAVRMPWFFRTTAL